jgi:hypothetical protein
MITARHSGRAKEHTMKRLHPVVVGGAIVGVLDIIAAFAVRAAFAGVRPAVVLQGIASGLLGPAAFRGGDATAALGMVLHFVIAFAVAAVYYVASRGWPVLVQRPIVCGMIYGVLVHVVMNQVVLPMSRVTVRPPPWSFVATMIVIHMVCVGLPVALTVARADRDAFNRASRSDLNELLTP